MPRYLADWQRGWACRSWAWLSAFITPLILTIVLGTIAQADKPAADPQRKAAWITYEGMITELGEQYLRRNFAQARHNGIRTIILEIDSPGGELLAAQILRTNCAPFKTWK